jgi:CMP-N,N'-diacetyllegionaminic acid synthase
MSPESQAGSVSDPSRILGLIPAKGGSRRLPRKNVLELDGKPLIRWAAEAGWASGVIDRLILSTDDEEIARTAVSFGLDVPFMRPADLGRDPAGVEQVALHALDEMERLGERYSDLVILLATSPLRTANDVRLAFETYQRLAATNLMSVTVSEHNPFTAMRAGEGESLEPVFPSYATLPAQQLPVTYRPNGAIHILNVANFRKTRSYLAVPIHAYVMPRDRAVDIDLREDLEYAEFVLRRSRGQPANYARPDRD